MQERNIPPLNPPTSVMEFGQELFMATPPTPTDSSIAVDERETILGEFTIQVEADGFLNFGDDVFNENMEDILDVNITGNAFDVLENEGLSSESSDDELPWEDFPDDTSPRVGNFNIEVTDSVQASEVKNENDISDKIPGFYRMMYLYKDNGVNGLVDKIILSREAMEKFCNEVSPGSYRSETDVDYKKLCKESLHYIGIYGNPVMIANLLFRLNAISEDIEKILRNQCENPVDTSNEASPSLSAGIYLYHDKLSGCGLVIHWPEHGAFKENASADKQKNMVNFQRYLFKLTNRQVCLMTKADVASFHWKDESDSNENFFSEEQDDNICFEFEVQKNQEQKEDFRLRDGFQIRIPNPILPQEDSEFPDLDLRPEILESIHHQTLVTKCLLPASIRNVRKTTSFSALYLKRWIRQTLPNHKLALPENITLYELRILVRHAPPELFQECFQSFKDASHHLEQNLKGEQQKNLQDAIREIDPVYRWVGNNFARYIQELYLDPIRKRESIGAIDQSGNINGQSVVNAAEIQRGPIDDQDMPSKFHSTIHREFQEYLSKVNDSIWKRKKRRLFFCRQLAYIVWRSQKAEVLSQSEDHMDEPSTIDDSTASITTGLSRIFSTSFFRKDKQSKTDLDRLSILIDAVPSNEEENAAFVHLFHTIFMNKETRTLALLARTYLSSEKSSWLAFVKNKTLGDPLDALIAEMMGQADRDMNSTPDPEILKIVWDTMDLKFTRRSLYPDDDDNDLRQSRIREFRKMAAEIHTIFVDALKNWTNDKQMRVGIKEFITRTLKGEASKLNDEMKATVESDIAMLKEKSRKEIREGLLTQYASGHDLFINRIQEQYGSYILEYEMTKPTRPKVSLSFYETQLDQFDVQKLETEAIDDESYRPIPQFYSYGLHKAPVLEYDPAKYSIRKMYQLENGKILCFLRIIEDDSTELYYEKASRISSAIADNAYFKKYPRKFQLTAYDDVNGLLALYSTENAILNVYSFDEKKNDLFMRNPNIQILPWYNNVQPKLSQIVFITGTDDLCFVEISGRVRVFNLIIGQFLPVDGKFPRNSKVRCSPDGACLVAFAVKNDHEAEIDDTLDELWIRSQDEDGDEALSSSAESSDTEGSLITPSAESSTTKYQSFNSYIDPPATKEMFNASETSSTTGNFNEKLSDWEKAVAGDTFAHVFFVNNLKVASKVVPLPTMEDTYSIELSQLAGRQSHLLYVTSSYEYFASKILTITIERNEWRFNESNKTSVNFGKARLASFVEGGQIIEGSGTKFLKIEPDDFFVIRGEKRLVKEVLSDICLIVEGAFPPWLAEQNTDGFLDFKIDRKPNSNAYVDCYSSVYQRYPIDSCIEDNVEISATSKNALQIVLGISKEQTAANIYSDRFSNYVEDAFDELIKMTKKPASSLRDFTTGVQSIEEFDIIKLCKLSDARPVGHWLIQMSCLLPIQIAVATDGYFVPLKDGVITDMDSSVGGTVNLTSVSEAITFGWYESIYNFYGEHEVKVVSSMGEQSTGKSYILNHLCGSTFEGSAQRCTEGVWMSLVPTKRILYVVMDFEGLRSLERTPQEDMLLTLFNAAVSNLILYKNNFAIGRDISSMFHSFQDGATTFDPSNTSNMFSARLAIIIKDVPKQDRAGIVQEFKSKFSRIVSKEGDNNFISRLYNGQMSIVPWPVFNDVAFYLGLTELKKYLDNSKPKCNKARIFLPTIKTIMAKLKVCDWSSLDDSMVRIRASAIRLLIKQVIAMGIEGDESASWPLKNRDTGAIIEDEPATFIDIFDVSEIAIDDREIMPDSGLVLLCTSGTSFHDLSKEVRNYFESNAQERSAASDDAKWYRQYITFVKFIVDRRLRRARQWFLINTARFPSDHTEIAAASNVLKQESERLVATWSICGLTCAECNLRCLEQNDHTGKHNCFTDHRCHHDCEFAQDHGFGFDLDTVQIPPCGLVANHDGSHICKDSDHLCGQLCSLSESGNCQSTCAKQIGHQDEIHMCASRVHYCGEPCSLRTVKDPKLPSQWPFSCNNTCTIPYGEPHEIHKCENNMACPLRCCLPQCNKKCSSKDHFHALNSPTDYHMCGDEHQCFEKCESDGVCEVHTQPQEQEEHYVNSHGTFTYKKWVQTSKRLTCYQKIPAGHLTHTGSHVHAPIANLFHYCHVKCPLCEYYCTLENGHSQGEHDTSHGNMIQTFFSGLDDEFEHEGFKFNAGDRGNAFLCKMFCKSQGRHKHIDYCKSTDPAMCNTEGTQHITKVLEPNPHRPKDFVKHSLYWKRTGFKDPYSNEEKEMFGKCDALCSGEEHKRKINQNDSTNPNTPVKSYCELPILHAPLPSGSPLPNDGVGYVSSDGHYFRCRNPATANSSFHIIFVIDRSASMRLKDVRPLDQSPFAKLLRPRHNNRLGAVYDAVYRFIEARQNILRNRAAGGSSEESLNDRVSLLLFNMEGQTVFANQEIVGRDELMAEMVKYHALEGTNLSIGIRHAADICVKYHDPSRIPVIIFLSDGGGSYPRKDLKRLFNISAKIGAKPYLMTVLFGRDKKTNPALLQAMTDAANNHHKSKVGATENGSELRCQSYIALDAVQLVGYFTGIAQSLNEHKPALVRG